MDVGWIGAFCGNGLSRGLGIEAGVEVTWLRSAPQRLPSDPHRTTCLTFAQIALLVILLHLWIVTRVSPLFLLDDPRSRVCRRPLGACALAPHSGSCRTAISPQPELPLFPPPSPPSLTLPLSYSRWRLLPHSRYVYTHLDRTSLSRWGRCLVPLGLLGGLGRR